MNRYHTNFSNRNNLKQTNLIQIPDSHHSARTITNKIKSVDMITVFCGYDQIKPTENKKSKSYHRHRTLKTVRTIDMLKYMNRVSPILSDLFTGWEEPSPYISTYKCLSSVL